MPIFTPNDQFTLRDHTGRLIAHGSMSAVTQHIVDSKARSDSLSLLEDAAYALGVMERQELEKQQLDELKVRHLCDSAARLAIRFDAFEQRRLARQRADAARRDEEEQRQIQQMLDSLPDPDEPGPYAPGGELHDIQPSAPEDLEQLQQSDQGGLPRELTKEVPVDPGTDPIDAPSELDKPPDPPAQPVSISLNSEN